MSMKTLLAAAIAAIFATSLAYAGGDKKASGSSQPSAATSSDGGAEAMFKSLDKNNDGFVTKEEAAGTPHEKDFATLDKNSDGKLSREEHAAAPEHSGKTAGASSEPRAAGSTGGGSKKY